MTAAGSLRHRVTIESPTETQDEYGAVSLTWSTVAVVYAEIVPLTGREKIHAEQQSSDLSHRVTVRYLSGVTPRMRVLFGARVLEVSSVRDIDERRRWTEMLCREVLT